MTAKKLPEGLHIDTLAVRAAVDKSQYGENSEALFLTSSFTQPDSETAARRFSGLEDGYIYSRFTNPTNASMEQRLAALVGRHFAPDLATRALAMAERYVPRLLGEAWASMKARYGFVPKNPVHVELYQSREHFSVRTSGLPNIGIQGVCFGKLVAAMSPSSGSFDWAAITWHELAHVFHIQLSQNRVPRWLTEGISTYEEKLHRPEWARGQDMEFASMLNEGTTLKLRDLNSGFTNPRLISISYFQASILVEHIVDTFGMEGLQKLLRA